jgi:aryl-alcohol dehydrogenase-like predicted oxidoreductase
MQYRKLGRTSLDVSVICLGTMTWGRQNSEEEGHAQMDYALEQDVNFFDTAEMYAIPPNKDTYGKTEEIIGNWFAKSGKRDKIILATKVAGAGLSWVRGGDYKIDRKNILEAVEGSLKRLRTDYIDLYQLHWPNRESYHFDNFWDYRTDTDSAAIENNFFEVLETLNELIKAGKIRHAGLSNETAWGAMKYLQLAKDKNLPRMVSIQNEYSLLRRVFEPDLQEVAQMENIGLLAWSPLATGMISGKYLDGARPPGTRWTLLNGRSSRDTEDAARAVRSYIELAKKHGLDVCQMALAFIHRQPFVTATIIGATSMEQLKSNIASIDLELSEDVLKDIEQVRQGNPLPY